MTREDARRAARPAVIFGAGPFARTLLSLCRSNDQPVVACAVDDEYVGKAQLQSLPVVPFTSLPSLYSPADYDVLVAVGYASMRARREIFERVRRAGYACCNVMCAGSMVSPDAGYGENNIFFPGVVVEPYVRLGDNNVLWSGAIVSHDTSVGSHNYCAPRVAISGNCTVGDLCFFGTAAAVIDGVEVASETYLRAGSTLFENTRPLGKYAGNPAMRVGEIDPVVGLKVGGKSRMEHTDG